MPIKRNPTCWCKAYPFPHKVGGGKCNRRKLLPKTKRRAAMKNAAIKRARKAGRYRPRSK